MGYTTYIVLAGTALLGACSGMVGTFAVLRRRALMGDALAHAALPGVCLAFLVVGERSLPALLFGALVTGLLGILVVAGLRFGTRIKEDAAIGIVLSVFYGAGIALSRTIQNQTARGSRAGLDSYILGKTSWIVESDVYVIAVASLLSLLVILLLFKEFMVVSFDTGFAHVQGWPAARLDLLLMLMVAVTVVIGLPVVGVVLMAALLIIPAAAARFWTDRLGVMLALAAMFGALTGAGGTLISSHFAWSTGPSIVLAGAGLFVASMLLGPRRGLLRQLWVEREFRRTVAEDSLLRRIYDFLSDRTTEDRTFSIAKVGGMTSAVRRLARSGEVKITDGTTAILTDGGYEHAKEVALAYRMLDLYLTEYSGQITEAPQGRSKMLEQIPPELRDELERRVQN